MKKVSSILTVSLITNFMLSLFKIMTGIIGSSGALIADGIHSFSDLVTDIVGIIGSIFSKKPSDEKHPYGHGKMEYLISIFIGLVILSLGFMIIYDSINRKVIVPSVIVIFVSLFTIVVKFLLAHFLVKKGRELNSCILVSSGKESSTDVISSVVVLVASILMQTNIEIFKYSDIIAGILVGIFVVKVGFDVLKENISTILGEQETDFDYLNEVKKVMLENAHIKNIDDLIILKYGPYYKLIARVSITHNLSITKAYEIILKIENNIKEKFERIDYVNISLQPDK
ncbi:MAG: cation transporter [Bacilli bacterium]|nr:cation transporter [Bacilli bacterium]